MILTIYLDNTTAARLRQIARETGATVEGTATEAIVAQMVAGFMLRRDDPRPPAEERMQ